LDLFSISFTLKPAPRPPVFTPYNRIQN
jgi:hypothetical protein